MAAIDISSSGGGTLDTGILQLENGVAMSTTLTPVTDQSNTASQLKLASNLTQIAGTLQIKTDETNYIDIEDASGDNRFAISRLTTDQVVRIDFASNPVGSTTQVGAIRTYRNGTTLSNAMSFIEDGSVGIGTDAPVGILHLYKSAATTRLAIDGDAGQNRLISYRTGALQRFGLYVNNTAESGSNAGSNFAIRAYSDAGTLLSTPFFINRATGNVGVNTLTGTAKLQVVGSGSTSATTSLLVQNSSGNAALTITDDRVATINECFFGDSLGPRIRVSGGNGEISCVYNGLSLSGGSSVGINNNTFNVGPGSSTNGQLTVSLPAKVANTTETVSLSAGKMYYGLGEGRLIIQAQTNATGFNGIGNTYIAGGRNTNGGAHGNVYLGVDLTGALGNVGIGTISINASAILQADSTTKGFLPPRMTNAQRGLITTPAVGLMVYCTDAVEGIYVYKSTGWTFVA